MICSEDIIKVGDEDEKINIARTIVKMRREKGLTQEDIANYIGVSKASVSKWKPVRVILTLLFCRSLRHFLI